MLMEDQGNLFLVTYKAPLVCNNNFTTAYEHKETEGFNLIYFHPQTNFLKDHSGLAEIVKPMIKDRKGIIFLNSQNWSKVSQFLKRNNFSYPQFEQIYSNELLEKSTNAFNLFNQDNQIHSIYQVI